MKNTLESHIEYIKREFKTKNVSYVIEYDSLDTDIGEFFSFSFKYNNKKAFLVEGRFVNAYESFYEEMSSDNALLYFIGRKYISPYLKIDNELSLLSVNNEDEIPTLELELKNNLHEVIHEFLPLEVEDLSEIKIYSLKKDNIEYWCVLDKQGVWMNIPKKNFELTEKDYLAMHYALEMRLINARLRESKFNT